MFTNPPGFAFAHRTRVAMPRVLVVPGIVYPAVQAYGPLLSRLTGRARMLTKELEIYADPAQVPPEGYSLDTEIEGIGRAADEAGWDSFNLVGYAAGGLAAMGFAERYPHRLSSLTLIEPFGTGLDDPPEAWARFLDDTERVAGLPEDRVVSAFLSLNVRPRVPVPPPPPNTPGEAMALRPAGLAALVKLVRETRLDREKLAAFDRPVYVVYGSLSSDGYIAAAQALAEVFPQATIEEYVGTHHLSPPQRATPERLAQTLMKMWAEADELAQTMPVGAPTTAAAPFVAYAPAPGAEAVAEERVEAAVERTLRVRVPATSANLGAGFDVFGLALNLHNIFRVTRAEALSIEITGYAGNIPADKTNLVHKAFAHLHKLAGEPVPPVRIEMDLRVPPGKGLGSSATAVVGGLIAANTMLAGRYSQDEILREAVKLERGAHADNVTAALMGGLVVNIMDGIEIIALPVHVPPTLQAALFTPDFEMDTVRGRKLMPRKYTREDAVFNTSRTALLPVALSHGRLDLLRVAMQDRLHQPYREQLFPAMPMIIRAALDAGAHGACLSGGGSSVLALATEGLQVIGDAMARAARLADIRGEVRLLDLDGRGARADWEGEG
ncbi:MAG TPA: homoserine kinase [Chloroflexia bacterium]|nr:homoserine kinase [Chloroflexia bacterium]